MQCDKALWVKALRLMKHGVDPKSHMPMLGDVVVSAEGGTLTISGTTLERNVRINLPCEGDLEPVVIEWKPLLTVTTAGKAKKNAVITFEKLESGLRLETGGRKFEVPNGHPLDGRPVSIRDGTGKCAIEAFNADRLLPALEYVVPALCGDETRFHINLLAFDQGRLVATDGHRMHAALNVGGFHIDNLAHQVLCNCGRVLIDAIKATKCSWVMARTWRSGRKEFVRGPNEYSLEGSMLDVLIREKFGDTTYPPIDQVIPQHEDFCVLDGARFRESAETAQKVMRATVGEDKGVTILVNGEMRLDGGSFAEVLELDEPAAREQAVGANPRFLVEAARGADAITFRYGGPLDPILIETDQDCLGVVMPMRVDGIEYDNATSEEPEDDEPDCGEDDAPMEESPCDAADGNCAECASRHDCPTYDDEELEHDCA
jgi:DNA polymerase III sliding clamp (beta) subunit (PCNA family)